MLALRPGREVRDHGRPLDVEDIEGVIGKLEKLDVDRRRIVGRSGLTPHALAAAEAARLEVGSLAEVARPDWWEPESFVYVNKVFDVVSMQLGFRPEDEAAALQHVTGTPTTEILVAGPDGTRPLYDIIRDTVLANEGHRTDLEPGKVYTLPITLSIDGAELVCRTGRLPLPAVVNAGYRIELQHEEIELTSLATFSGVHAFSGLSTSLKKQVTFVATEGPEGGRQISVRFEDPHPPKVQVEKLDLAEHKDG